MDNRAFQSTLLMRGATRRQQERVEAERKFQSTLLMRGATSPKSGRNQQKEFQSTLLMRGATRQSARAHLLVGISIHAPHARSDLTDEVDEIRALQISIHAPHARSDKLDKAGQDAVAEFQSTLLMRGATRCDLAQDGRPDISIHAPHARSDSIHSYHHFLYI